LLHLCCNQNESAFFLKADLRLEERGGYELAKSVLETLARSDVEMLNAG